MLDEANMADSAPGQSQRQKGRAAAVRDFGKRMMRDHHNLRTQGEALAKNSSHSDASRGRSRAGYAQNEMDTLNSTAKGKDFDKAYIDGEVDAHKSGSRSRDQSGRTGANHRAQKPDPESGAD